MKSADERVSVVSVRARAQEAIAKAPEGAARDEEEHES